MSILRVPTAPEDLIDFLINKGNGVKGLSQMSLTTVPDKFIQPLQERLDFTRIESGQSIPIIDFSSSDDPKVAESIYDAAEGWGFFQIINHGIPTEVLENVIEAGHKFFDLPVEERSKYLKENSPTHTVQLKTSFNPLVEKVLEWKDYLFHIYDSEDECRAKLWPAVSKCLFAFEPRVYRKRPLYLREIRARDQVFEYIKWAKPVIVKLLEVLLKRLDVNQMDEAMKSAVMGTLIVNLIHYPMCPNPELTVGAGRHADVSSITVLLQDDVGGLYVESQRVMAGFMCLQLKGHLLST